MTDAKCIKCNDTGFYNYDKNHSQFCEACCEHPTYKHYRQFEGQPNPGMLTCGICGYELGGKINDPI